MTYWKRMDCMAFPKVIKYKNIKREKRICAQCGNEITITVRKILV